MKFKLIILSIVAIVITSCSSNKAILEVTTFKIKPTANTTSFNTLDTEIENSFTNKQLGFIKRQSGINEKGEYVVLVYWNSEKDAQASMNKFMTDKSVSAYASMIDGETMEMSRYTVNKIYDNKTSKFIEIMAFNTKPNTNLSEFNKVNNKVETDFTASQKGFLQRIRGVNQKGQQIVAVYWDNKTNSDAALQPFMQNEISKEFMSMMVESSIKMGRYQTLSSITK